MNPKERDDLSKAEKAKLIYKNLGHKNRTLHRVDKRHENKHPKLKSTEQKSPPSEKKQIIQKAKSAKVGNATERAKNSLEKAKTTHEELKKSVNKLLAPPKVRKSPLREKREFRDKLGPLKLTKIGDKLQLQSNQEELLSLNNLGKFDKALHNQYEQNRLSIESAKKNKHHNTILSDSNLSQDSIDNSLGRNTTPNTTKDTSQQSAKSGSLKFFYEHLTRDRSK